MYPTDNSVDYVNPENIGGRQSYFLKICNANYNGHCQKCVYMYSFLT